MTNGEKIIKTFPDEDGVLVEGITCVYYGTMRFDTTWWNAEYKEQEPRDYATMIAHTDYEKVKEKGCNTCRHQLKFMCTEWKECKDLSKYEPREPEQKSGKWIRIDKDKCKCDQCEVISFIAMYPNGDANYCPNCGAKMEREDKE